MNLICYLLHLADGYTEKKQKYIYFLAVKTVFHVLAVTNSLLHNMIKNVIVIVVIITLVVILQQR